MKRILHRYIYGMKLPQTVTASLQWTSQGVDINAGTRQFSITGSQLGKPQREHADFALFGLAVLAMTYNLNIKLDAPVTRSGLEHVRKLGQTWLTWCPTKIYPLSISASEIIEDDPLPREGGILCMSGGIDSTYAGLRARANYGFTHALLIAGADYSNSAAPGFQELKEHVSKLSTLCGLELVTASTDIRKIRFKWGLFHNLILAMCLHYVGGGIAFGGYAADNTDAQEFENHPWGNNHVIAEFTSTPNFPVHFLGRELGRSAKTRRILADDRNLIEHISVCYADTSFGGNCGKCFKCVRTRLNIATAGLDLPHLFRQNISITKYLKQHKIPRNEYERRCLIHRLFDVFFDLPKGPLRIAVADLLQRAARPLGDLRDI